MRRPLALPFAQASKEEQEKRAQDFIRTRKYLQNLDMTPGVDGKKAVEGCVWYVQFCCWRLRCKVPSGLVLTWAARSVAGCAPQVRCVGGARGGCGQHLWRADVRGEARDGRVGRRVRDQRPPGPPGDGALHYQRPYDVVPEPRRRHGGLHPALRPDAVQQVRYLPGQAGDHQRER